MQISTYSKPKSNWYLVYTIPNSEKKADLKLKQLGISSFLPLHTVVRQWSDRKKKLEVPLFPSYIFVYTSPNRRFDILQIKELMHFVSFGGELATVPEDIIESLKRILDCDTEIDTEKFYQQGMRVKIVEGQLSGTEGVLVRKNGRDRLVLQIDALRQAISIELPANQVECCVA